MPLEFKPRVRLDSWAPPATRGPRRSLWWLWALGLYAVVVVVGYLVVTGQVSLDDATWSETSSPVALTPPPATELAALPPSVSRGRAPSARALPLPPCEEFLEPVEGSPKNRQSSNLDRLGYASLLDNGSIRDLCRTRVRRRVAVCLAVNQGTLVGATVHTEPSDPATERCILGELRGLRYPVEATLRVVNTSTNLTARP